MQFILSFLVASGIAFATDSKPIAEGIQSEVWVIDPTLHPDSKEIKQYKHPNHLGAWLASHRTAKAAKIALALKKQLCLQTDVSIFGTNLFQPQEKQGDRYRIKSENCRVINRFIYQCDNKAEKTCDKKVLAQCDAGFNLRNIPEEGLEGYTVCVKPASAAPAEQGAGSTN